MASPNKLILMTHLTAKHILAITNLFCLFNFSIPWDVVRWKTTWAIEVILGVFATTLRGISRNVMNSQTGLLLRAETYKSLSWDFFLLLTWEWLHDRELKEQNR